MNKRANNGRVDREEGSYRVILMGIEDGSEERRDSFCKNLSEIYGISFPLMRKIVDRSPITLKKNLSLPKAEALASTLRSFGAIVLVEEKKDLPVFSLEFQDMAPHRVALESCDLRKMQPGIWQVIGRGRNISEESLHDTWVLVQIFNEHEEFLSFEEAPVPLSPIPSRIAFPFKVVFEADRAIQKVSITFKHASGSPIPAADSRKKREWEEVEFREEPEESSQSLVLTEPLEDISSKQPLETAKDHFQPSEPETYSHLSKESIETEGDRGEEIAKETPLLEREEESREVTTEAQETRTDLILEMSEEDETQRQEGLETQSEDRPSQVVPLPLREEVSSESEHFPGIRTKTSQETQMDLPGFEQASESFEESLLKAAKGAEEKPSPFLWMEEFRNAVETYRERERDMFSVWFETYRREEGFSHPLHSLLTILVYSRFLQVNESEKALENTHRVVKFIGESILRLEEIPPLEGTQFFSGESWRELFHKAFAKLQQVANSILRKEAWNALDLERLIRVIPHMGDKNSRMAVKWLHELIPDVVKIDFSNVPIHIGENLYRVASRLGVVDPHFDYYQGKDSIGDKKIQSFAKSSFPEYPMKVEDPMAWVGRQEEGGHCSPIQPRCDGCLFETFCPKLHLHFNPSGKGMRGR